MHEHLRISLRLFRTYGAQLAVIWLAGGLVGSLLLDLAVRMGLASRIAGLIAMVAAILLQLVIFVAMFVVLRDGLPLLGRARHRMANAAPPPVASDRKAGDAPAGAMSAALLAVLVPFYLYYAGWGFLGNTLRIYSQRFLDAQWERIDLMDSGSVGADAFAVGNSLWVVAAVIAIWLMRRIAKRMQAKGGARFWPLLVVACEATWVILGLMVIGHWKQGVVDWLASLPTPQQVLGWFFPMAAAEVTSAAVRPVDWAPPVSPADWLVSLFWYAMLPLIWFNLGAIVYGHNLAAIAPPTHRVASGALDRWKQLPKPITDFLGHFWEGLVKRWHAVANGVLLAASSGVALTVSIILWWRLADWLGRWAWMGAAALIGPQQEAVWQVLRRPLDLLFGTPGQPQDGVAVVVVQFCILAAGLELAGRARVRAIAVEARGEG